MAIFNCSEILILQLQHELTDTIFGLETKLQCSAVGDPYCILTPESEKITWRLLIKGNVSI